MVEILQNKNAATRFQVMVEIAASGPSIQQKSIAAKLNVTPQAISDYIHQLVTDGLVVSTGRSEYRVSTRGVDWMLAMFRELRDYAAVVEKAVTNITVCAALADSEIEKGRTVYLTMKDGLLYASPQENDGAKGIALSSVRAGEDVDIANIEGLVALARGHITILQVPVVREGGSRQTDMGKLEKQLSGLTQTGAIGIEALVSMKQAGNEPRYLYGVTDAAIEASQCGLPFAIVCTEDAIPGLIKRLQEEDLPYTLIDLHR